MQNMRKITEIQLEGQVRKFQMHCAGFCASQALNNLLLHANKCKWRTTTRRQTRIEFAAKILDVSWFRYFSSINKGFCFLGSASIDKIQFLPSTF